ncbi:hypothetical protein [Pseudomonas soli]|uniref:hypothetical protein n=1 Tax=Pseudomonas soli TaxID=1306993 RepID=UPI00299F2C40|nr:hypothetical protein [Pseudomonas soli]MDW9401815.1 hypothetical protein [Pseudomonas soli]
MLSFELNYKIKEKKELFLCIFPDSETLNEAEYAEIIEQVYEQNFRPDQVTLIYPKYISDKITKIFQKNSIALKNAERYGPLVPFSLLAFDSSGNLSCENNIEWDAQSLSKFRDKLCRTGLMLLAQKNEVIEIAPPGTTFRKPSEREYREFLATSKLCTGSCEEKFLSFCLLDKIPADTSNIKQIFLDTQSISYIINNLALMLMKFGKTVSFTHKSFSSYAGLEKNKPDNPNSVFVIISASTSNSLMEKTKTKWGLKDDQIVTILSYKDHDRVLSNISGLSKNHNTKFISDIHVKRISEHFTAEYLEPRSVVIKKLHGKNIDTNIFQELHNTTAFTCHKTKTTNNTRREFHINAEKLHRSSELKNWLSALVKNHVPASTKWLVIDTSDVSSKFFSKAIKTALPDMGESLKIIDYKDAIDEKFNSSKDALLAFAPVIGSGNIFMSLNRDLRIAKHDGMRIFATFIHLYKGETQRDQFKKSLVYGPEFNQYKFFAKNKISMPFRHEKSSWEMESKFIASFHEDHNFWEDRYNTLNKGSTGLNGLIGINGRTPNQPLKFSRHFAFWDFKYSEQNVSPESIYFMVSTILQHARDEINLAPEDSLKGDIYQQAVLSPDVFIRFNDPLLQSCLWRTATLSELDYSSNELLSDHFADILSKLLEHFDNEKGEAALDLLLGVAMAKIKLCETSIIKITSKITSINIASGLIEPLLTEIEKLYHK